MQKEPRRQKVSKFQKEFLKPSFLPKYEPNIIRFSDPYSGTLFDTWPSEKKFDGERSQQNKICGKVTPGFLLGNCINKSNHHARNYLLKWKEKKCRQFTKFNPCIFLGKVVSVLQTIV